MDCNISIVDACDVMYWFIKPVLSTDVYDFVYWKYIYTILIWETNYF